MVYGQFLYHAVKLKCFGSKMQKEATDTNEAQRVLDGFIMDPEADENSVQMQALPDGTIKWFQTKTGKLTIEKRGDPVDNSPQPADTEMDDAEQHAEERKPDAKKLVRKVQGEDGREHYTSSSEGSNDEDLCRVTVREAVHVVRGLEKPMYLCRHARRFCSECVRGVRRDEDSDDDSNNEEEDPATRPTQANQWLNERVCEHGFTESCSQCEDAWATRQEARLKLETAMQREADKEAQQPRGSQDHYHKPSWGALQGKAWWSDKARGWRSASQAAKEKMNAGSSTNAKIQELADHIKMKEERHRAQQEELQKRKHDRVQQREDLREDEKVFEHLRWGFEQRNHDRRNKPNELESTMDQFMEKQRMKAEGPTIDRPDIDESSEEEELAEPDHESKNVRIDKITGIATTFNELYFDLCETRPIDDVIARWQHGMRPATEHETVVYGMQQRIKKIEGVALRYAARFEQVERMLFDVKTQGIVTPENVPKTDPKTVWYNMMSDNKKEWSAPARECDKCQRSSKRGLLMARPHGTLWWCDQCGVAIVPQITEGK